MPRILYRLLALVLALGWVPAATCCSIQAAGFDVPCSNVECDHGPSEAASACDDCNVAAEGLYQRTGPLTKLAPQLTMVCACLVCIPSLDAALENEQASFTAEAERTRGWVPIWQFERRAAALAHAPDSLTA